MDGPQRPSAGVLLRPQCGTLGKGCRYGRKASRSTTFGNPAASSPPRRGGPWLCVPASRRGCLYRAALVVPLRARHIFSPTDSSPWHQYRCRCPLCRKSMLWCFVCVNRYYRNRTPKYWRQYFSTERISCLRDKELAVSAAMPRHKLVAAA